MLTRIKNSDFLKNTITLIIGTATVNLIPIAFQPILRNLYSVETFGAMAVYTSILSIAISFFSLRYPLAIYLPKRIKDAFNLVILSWSIAIIFTIIFYIILYFYLEHFVAFVNFPTKYKSYLYLLPLSIFLFSINDTFNHWLIRNNLVKKTILIKFIKRLTDSFSALSFGAFGSTGGLFYSDVIGGLMQSIAAFVLGFKSLLFKSVTVAKVKGQAKTFHSYPLYNSGPALLNTLSLGLPIIVINANYSAEIAGYFDLTKMVLMVPISLVSMSLSKIIMQKFAEKFRGNFSIMSLFLKISFVLFAISLFLISLILLFGSFGFDLFFGEKWANSASFAKILVFGISIKLIVSPLSSILNAINKIKLVSLWQIFYFLLIFILSVITINNIYTFLKIYILVDIIAYVVYYILILFSVKKYDAQLIQ